MQRTIRTTSYVNGIAIERVRLIDVPVAQCELFRRMLSNKDSLPAFRGRNALVIPVDCTDPANWSIAS